MVVRKARVIHTVALLLCVVYCMSLLTFSASAGNSDPLDISLSPNKGSTPYGSFEYVYLVEGSTVGQNTTYEIIVYFTATQNVASIKIPHFTITNGSSLNTVTYFTYPSTFQKNNIGASSGSVSLGYCQLPSSVSDFYVTTSYAQMYFYSYGDWLDIDNLHNYHANIS